MTHPVVRPLRLVSHSPMLECDVSRRIGWYVRWPNGERGKLHRTRDEARGELRGDTDHDVSE